MVRVTRTTAATTTTTTTKPLDRRASLQALSAAFDAAKKPPKAELHAEGYDVHTVKGTKARVLEIDIGMTERPLLDGKKGSLHHLYLDEANQKFYASTFGDTFGPLPLPKGVSYASLLDVSPHKPKNAEEKAVAALAGHVKGQLGAAHLAGRTQVDASKRGLEHLYIKDPSGVIPGQGLIVAKDKLWIEMIPGYSGDCIGPFTLPKGYTKETLIAALTSTPAEKPKPSRTVDDDRPRRTTVIGGGSNTWPSGAGGRGSGLSSISVRFRGGGGGGGSP